MGHGVISSAAVRTSWRWGTTDTMKVGVEMRAMTGAELGKDATGVTRKRFLGLVDGREPTTEDVVVGVVTNGAMDVGGVDALFGSRVRSWRNGAIDEKRVDIVDARIL